MVLSLKDPNDTGTRSTNTQKKIYTRVRYTQGKNQIFLKRKYKKRARRAEGLVRNAEISC